MVVHPLSIGRAGLLRLASSGQAPLRHPGVTTYRCFLPDLTGFVGSCRAGPSLHRRLAFAVPTRHQPRGGIRPRYSGLRVQGTASSPSSTTKNMIPQPSSFVKQTAERAGFEPARACALHDFQSCALGQAMRPLHERREWDSNPRGLAPYAFSRRAHSARLCDPSIHEQVGKGCQPA